MFINSIKYEIILNPQRRTGLHSCSPPNQSLKLTEPAVDDLTRANQTVTCWTGHTTRGMDSVAAALRRRSLAPVR
jgi:hypothetical protein